MLLLAHLQGIGSVRSAFPVQTCQDIDCQVLCPPGYPGHPFTEFVLVLLSLFASFGLRDALSILEELAERPAEGKRFEPVLETVIRDVDDHTIALARGKPSTSTNTLHVEGTGLRRPRH